MERRAQHCSSSRRRGRAGESDATTNVLQQNVGRLDVAVNHRAHAMDVVEGVERAPRDLLHAFRTQRAAGGLHDIGHAPHVAVPSRRHTHTHTHTHLSLIHI